MYCLHLSHITYHTLITPTPTPSKQPTRIINKQTKRLILQLLRLKNKTKRNPRQQLFNKRIQQRRRNKLQKIRFNKRPRTIPS